MGEIKYNGRTYSGLIQANGCFVDTTNILLSATAFVGSYSYTATEDCFVCFYISPRVNDDTFIQIDGENVETWWRSSVITDTASFYVRKGQTISVPNAHASNNSYIWVYGLLQGSPITFLSEYASACYDTNEREVGCWVNGKPLYKKTWELTVPNASGTYMYNEATPNLEDVAHTEYTLWGLGERGDVPWYSSATILFSEQTDTGIEFYFASNNYAGRKIYFTSYYTKTTDTAGSGKLTPTGFETHHYSTNEQIVGTWIDGKPLYEVTVEVDNPTINSYSNKKYVEATYSSSVIDFAKCVSCTVYDSTDSRWYTLPYERMLSSENINIQAMCLANGSFAMTAHWDSSNSYNVTKIRYTIQFTKTTD